MAGATLVPTPPQEPLNSGSGPCRWHSLSPSRAQQARGPPGPEGVRTEGMWGQALLTQTLRWVPIQDLTSECSRGQGRSGHQAGQRPLDLTGLWRGRHGPEPSWSGALVNHCRGPSRLSALSGQVALTASGPSTQERWGQVADTVCTGAPPGVVPSHFI